MNELQILVFKDGNNICALHGEDLQSGTAGFGSTVTNALRDLARQLDEEQLDLESEL
jgi:hypothetical protein